MGDAVFKSFLAFLLLAGFTASPVDAQTKGTVTFSGLKNLEFIQNYYNGGTGSFGSGPGPDYALTFTSNTQAIISASQGGSGNFINNPGKTPVMFFQTGSNVTMTATNSVSVAILFYYSALQPGSLTVYEGPNGTGNILANVALNPNNSGCNSYKLCVWSPVGIPLSSAAGSLRFSGSADNIAIGKISLGNKLPTKTFLASSAPQGSSQGQPVTFTATISCPGAVAAGTVSFRANNVLMGPPVTVVNGTASITTSSLPVGTNTIFALFKGTDFTQSSATISQLVNP
jgi:hypothetical protein